MITFPNIDPVAFELGPLVVRWYALAYMVGLIGGWQYAVYLAKKNANLISTTQLDDFILWATLGIIVGGRVGYVLFYQFGYYLEHPAAILQVWRGGMSFHGGTIGLALAIIIYAKRVMKTSPLILGDFICTVVPIGLFFGRIANFVNAELYGRETTMPWGVIFPDGGPHPRHPSQIYEAILEGLIPFLFFNWLVRKHGALRHPGLMTGVWFLCYAVARFIVEFFRQPDAQLGFVYSFMSMGQLLSLPMMVVGLTLIIYAKRTTKT